MISYHYYFVYLFIRLFVNKHFKEFMFSISNIFILRTYQVFDSLNVVNGLLFGKNAGF